MPQGCTMGRVQRFLLLVCLVVRWTTTAGQSPPRSEIVSQLLIGYDYKTSPNFDRDEPLVVNVSVQVSGMSDIDDKAMKYSVTLFLKQWWIDSRLKFARRQDIPYLTLDPRMQPGVWVPDLYFSNSKSANMHDTMFPNSIMRLYPNGTVFNSVRMSLVLDCAMDLRRYPMDSQACNIDIGTIASDSRAMLFEWARGRPIGLSSRMVISEFSLTNYTVSQHLRRYSDLEGTFSSLHIHFLLRRDVGYYVIQTYLPFALIVILSWVSFWIDPKSPPARVGLGITTVLTLTTQSAALERRLPKVSYIKAIDIWASFCSIMVFTALIEYAVVNVLQRWEAEAKQQSAAENRATQGANELAQSLGKGSSSVEMSANGRRASSPTPPAARHRWLKATSVDYISRIAFPVIFVVFNAIYWPVFIDLDNSITT